MKLSAVAITGFLTLNIITVAFTASVRSYATSNAEPGADKRSVGCTECASMENKGQVTAEKRSMDCTECTNMVVNAEAQSLQSSPNPMNPYLSLKPFLPVKPTFVPPFVDPNYFINKKADLLNNLFGAIDTQSSDSKPSSVEAKRDSVDDFSNSVQPRLAAFSPFLASSTVKPKIVPPGYWMPMGGPGIVDPATMIDKKAKFLNTLFSKTTAPDSSVAARAVAPEDVTSDVTPAKESILPSDFWLQFLKTLTAPDPAAITPTIPPGFWIPPAKPFIPKVPTVDPSEFIDKKTAFLNTLFKTLNITTTPTTVKPTIVPLEYWMPLSGPGTVDPATVIDKKTKFLNTLFSKIPIPDTSAAARAVVPEDTTSTATQSAVPADFWSQFLPILTTPESPAVKSTIVPPGFWLPSSISMIPAKPSSSKVPVVDPSEFTDKKTDFLNALFKTLNITVTPAESTPASKPAYLQKVVSPTVKPTIVPPGYWMPISGPGIVNPATMIDKKTKFLSTLFSKTTVPDSSVAARAVIPEDLTSATSTEKQSVVPTDLWFKFLPTLTTSEPPAVKPTIVPPGFWIPSFINKTTSKPSGSKTPSLNPSEFIDKKTAFLNTLFKALNITITSSPATTDSLEDFLNQLLSLAVNNNTQQSTIKRSMAEISENERSDNSRIPSEEQGSVIDTPKVTRQSAVLFNKRSTDTEDISVQSPMPVDALLDAKDRLTNIIMSELSSIKNNILDNINEILAQQKEAAAISASTASKKKPGPTFGPSGPFGPWGAAFLKTMPKSTPDPTPFQNKIEFLSQKFDAVTKLENDAIDALNEAINENFSKPTSPSLTSVTSMDQVTNPTVLFQLIKSKLSELENSNDMQVPKLSRATFTEELSAGVPVPKPTIVEPSFWIPKVTPGAAVDPTFYLSKTQDFLNKLFTSKATGIPADNSETAAYDKVRSIKMAVHQGYQSLPPGTEELLQAGGGSNSMDHEGGGLKLQEDMVPVPVPVIPNKEGHHHHNHHNNK